MENALRTLILFALAGAAVSMLAWMVAWRLDPRKRLRRALRKVLGREPDAEAVAAHQGRALSPFPLVVALPVVAPPIRKNTSWSAVGSEGSLSLRGWPLPT